MKILAFLQNMWVKDPAAYERSLQRSPSPEYREKLRARMIEYALFAGCLTGRRLKAALGEDLCDQIIWEEASPFVADNPRDYHPPDPLHIQAVLAKHQPDAVLTFTRRGEKVIRELCSCPVISASHPAARGASVLHELAAMRKAIDAHKLSTLPLPDPVSML